jgi:ABC-type Fe3+-siderophore transport system permease subunit
MTKFVRQKRIIMAIVIILSLALSVYRITVIQDNIDVSPTAEDANYYLKDTFETNAFAIITASFILLFSLSAFFLRKKIKNEIETAEPSVIFTSSLSGFLIIGCIFYYFFYFVKKDTQFTFFIAGIIITALLSAVYLLLNASGKTESLRKTVAWFLVAPVACSALRLLNEFVRRGTSHNPSSSVYLLLSIIAFMLFFLAEGKFKSGTGSPALYMLFGFLSIQLSLTYSLPTLYLSGFWVFPPNVTMLYSAADLTVAMYIAARLFQLKCVEKESIPTGIPVKQS